MLNSKNVFFRKGRVNLFPQFTKKPLQGIAALTLSATINDIESQKQIPILNRSQELRESLRVAFSLGLELAPECKGLVVILDHRKQVCIVAELSKERSG